MKEFVFNLVSFELTDIANESNIISQFNVMSFYGGNSNRPK